MKKVTVPTIFTALLLLSGTALAQSYYVHPPKTALDNVFVSATLGGSHSDEPVDAADSTIYPDTSGDRYAYTGFIFVGSKVTKNIDVRLGYGYLGSYETSVGYPGFKGNAKYTWTAYTADVLLKHDINKGAAYPIYVYFKLGAAYTHAKTERSGDFVHDSDTDSQLRAVPGLGLEVAAWKQLAGTLEVNYYHKLAGSGNGTSFNMTTVTAGLRYNF